MEAIIYGAEKSVWPAHYIAYFVEAMHWKLYFVHDMEVMYKVDLINL